MLSGTHASGKACDSGETSSPEEQLFKEGLTPAEGQPKRAVEPFQGVTLALSAKISFETIFFIPANSRGLAAAAGRR